MARLLPGLAICLLVIFAGIYGAYLIDVALETTECEEFYSFWSSFSSVYILMLAMAGVGLSTNLKIFRDIGLKPFFIGLIAAISVGLASLLLISLFGDLVQMAY